MLTPDALPGHLFMADVEWHEPQVVLRADSGVLPQGVHIQCDGPAPGDIDQIDWLYIALVAAVLVWFAVIVITGELWKMN